MINYFDAQLKLSDPIDKESIKWIFSPPMFGEYFIGDVMLVVGILENGEEIIKTLPERELDKLYEEYEYMEVLSTNEIIPTFMKKIL